MSVRILIASVLLVTESSCGHAIAYADNGIQFQLVNEQVGLVFQHNSPITNKRHTHLTMGSGLAWVDVDYDERPDLFCCQGQTLEASTAAAKSQWASLNSQPAALFRNSAGRFVNVGAKSGLSQLAYQTGVTIGDFNNDGMDDLFVSAFGPNQLYENNGDGTYSLVPHTKQVLEKYSASTTFFDANNDGALDVFVANYLKLNFADYQVCSAERNGKKFYISCHPRVVPPETDDVWQNQSDGRFAAASQKLGFRTVEARQGLGVIAADFDRNGTTDLYVANDSVANHLWNNAGNAFTEDGLLSGTAFNRIAQREAGMGLACNDINGDGLLDLFVTNFQHESNTLYRNEGALLFFDITDEIGLAETSRPKLGFGTNFVDADNDGWVDLFIANGHIHDQLELMGESGSFRQAPLMMKNRDGIRFEDCSAQSGPYFGQKVLGRGSAVADFDGDGRQDLAISQLNDRLILLKNTSSEQGQFIQLKLVGTTSNRSGIGATVDVKFGQRIQAVPRLAASSYLSADSATLGIGISQQQQAQVSVQWPNGTRENFGTIAAGQSVVLIEGRGKGVAVSWDD